MNFRPKNGLSVATLLILIFLGSFVLVGFALHKDSSRFFEAEVEVERWFRAAFRTGMDSKPKPEALPASTQPEALPDPTQPEALPAATQAEGPTGKL